MKIIRILIQMIIIINFCNCWEYCKRDIQSKLCGNQTHFACDSKHIISNIAKEFLAHVPLTRKVKASFLNLHNYYRNRTAGGWTKNNRGIYFPKAVRMRELIWDSELSYISHIRTKLVSVGELACYSTQRFPYVGQNVVVQGLNESKPVVEIIALSLQEMFDTRNFVNEPASLPNQFLKRCNGYCNSQ